MALNVEDGTGLPNADSFVELVDADAYHALFGNDDWASASTADKESAIIRSTFYLTNGFSWEGDKINGRDQALSFPRSGLTDSEGYDVASDSVPKEIMDATYELAIRELLSPGSLNPDVTPAEGVKREKIGEIEIEYVNSRTDIEASKPVVSIVNDLIGAFLESGSVNEGQAIYGTTDRL